MQVMADFVE